MAENTYQLGNTVRLSCNFKDISGNLVDPEAVKVIIYDARYNMIEEFILTNQNRIDVGQYFFDYTISMDAKGKLYYEWYGESSGVPSLRRSSFKVTFI